MQDNKTQAGDIDIPKAITDALYSDDTLSKIKAIADKHELHIDVMGDLESAVNKRIAGIIDDDDFKMLVGGRIRGPLYEEVLADVDTIIFQPIIEKLRAETAPQPPIKREVPTITQQLAVSAVAEKMSSSQMAPVVHTVIPPIPPQKYKGNDPYRESAE